MTLRKVRKNNPTLIKTFVAQALDNLLTKLDASIGDVKFSEKIDRGSFSRQTFKNMTSALSWANEQNEHGKNVYIELEYWLERQGLIGIRANFDTNSKLDLNQFIDDIPSANIIFKTGKWKYGVIWLLDESEAPNIDELVNALKITRADCLNARVIRKLRLPLPGYKNVKSDNFTQRIVHFNDDTISQVDFVMENKLSIWVPPRSIETEDEIRKDLPLNSLPCLLRKFIMDCSQTYCCPHDYAFAPLITMIGSLMGHKIHVKIDKKSDLIIAANFWAISIGDSGAGKSPVHLRMRELFAPLNEHAKADFAEASKHYKAATSINKYLYGEKLAVIKDKMEHLSTMPEGSAKDNKVGALVMELSKHVKTPEKPSLHRFTTNRSTLASLQKILGENPNGILMDLEELKGLIKHLSGSAGSDYRSFLLECSSGFGQHDIDRLTTGTTYASNMLLSVFSTTQPDVFYPQIRSTLNRTEDNDGLWQRFNILLHPKTYEYAPSEQGELDPMLLEVVQTLFKAISECDFGFSATAGLKARSVPISRQAKTRYYEWWDKINLLKSDDDIHPVYENYLAKYKTLVPKLALVFEMVSNFDPALSKVKVFKSVSELNTKRAIEVAEYLESHARHVFDVRTNFDQDNALTIMNRLDRLPAKFTARHIAQLNWCGMGKDRDSKKIIPALEILEKALVIRRVPSNKTQYWEINPYVLEKS